MGTTTTSVAKYSSMNVKQTKGNKRLFRPPRSAGHVVGPSDKMPNMILVLFEFLTPFIIVGYAHEILNLTSHPVDTLIRQSFGIPSLPVLRLSLSKRELFLVGPTFAFLCSDRLHLICWFLCSLTPFLTEIASKQTLSLRLLPTIVISHLSSMHQSLWSL